MNTQGQGTVAPGWLPDPSGRHELRWWDGVRWRDAVLDRGVRSDDPVPQSETLTAVMQGDVRSTSRRPESDAEQTASSEVADEKITVFSAKRIAKQFREENKELRHRTSVLEGIAREYGGLDAAQIALRLDALRSEEAALQEHHADLRRAQTDELAKIDARVARARAELESVEQKIIVARDRIDLEAKGLFDFAHVAEVSAELASELDAVRMKIRETNKYDKAIHATTNFTFNNSTAKGKTFVNQMRRIMLRAYNAEAENAVKTVKTGNLAPAKKRLARAKEQIEKQGTMIDLQVDNGYHRLRVREIELAARHHEAVAAEKMLERERKEELREQRRAEQELKAEKERLTKERTHYLNSIRKLRDSGDDDKADELESQLARIDEEIAQADYRAANIRAGYVYVISNIGAFGEGVVKIGMTRRLEPMDRVRELGDASVPFTFDVHAMFFSEDAVSVEAALHREFADQRINQVNQRKEFFRVAPSDVLEALKKHRVSVLEFRTDVDAEEFRQSMAIIDQRTGSTARR